MPRPGIGRNAIVMTNPANRGGAASAPGQPPATDHERRRATGAAGEH